MMKVFVLCIAVMFSGLPFNLSAQQPVRYQEARRLMWTTFEIVAYGENQTRLAEAAEAAFEEIERLDHQLSNYSETSELTYINRNAAHREITCEKELFDLLQYALDYSRATDGAFDITVGPLMKAWGFFKGQGRVPDAKALQAVMANVGYEHVKLHSAKRAIRFDREGIELDLGGIAKGYAVDKAAEILRASGVQSALITAGSSSIYAIGTPPNQTSWKIAVNDPTSRARQVTTLELKDQSISTSGCHEKSFEIGEKTYCHIMNPRTGYPVDGILSATIITPRGVDAEVFSKVVMVSGIDKARAFFKDRKETRALIFYRQADGSAGTVRLNF
ncbi:MAG: FAD:protein FMN transferase [Acidobacteriota bacterium]